MNGLAILVLGNACASTDEVFSMPAHLVDGTPIVVKAALRQFGDKDVRFRSNIPMIKVEGSASTVLELHILRKEVSDWKECSIPLRYLGVRVSAVRGTSLISTTVDQIVVR